MQLTTSSETHDLTAAPRVAAVTSAVWGGGAPSAGLARGEIDGLAAILESHFRWEERAVVAALDGLADPTLTREGLFG